MSEQVDEQLFEDNEDSFIINMEEVENTSFELIPKGMYNCIIEDCEFTTSESSGQYMWKTKLMITDGDYEGKKLIWFGSFSEKALSMTKGNIARFAPELLSASFNPKKIADDGDLVGVSVRAKVVINKYQGENRSQIKDLYAGEDSENAFATA